MKRNLPTALAVLALVLGWAGSCRLALGQVPENSYGRRGGDSRFGNFNALTTGATTHDGLFKLYHKDDQVYMELPPHHLNKSLLCPITIARGAGMGGSTLNFDEQWVLIFTRVGDKIHLVRRNVHFKAKSGSPTAMAVETTYTDSVLMALSIRAINPANQAALISLNDIFMTNFAQLPSYFGSFDPSRSVWHKIKTFKRNIELEVQATYGSGGRGRFGSGSGSSIDPRGRTIVLHYGLVELPDSGYHPRLADDRVGYFLTAVKDFSSESKDTTFVRYINRWRLEPAEHIDPKNPQKLVVPLKSIKFWIEKDVPHEYRAAVRAGILEWNKAFEKIGFRDAIEVVQQGTGPEDEFDPEDMDHNTFRWVTTGRAFAMGPSRANPLTGEILDADILFDADFVRYWKHEQKVFSGNGMAFEPASPIQSLERGWQMDHPLLGFDLDRNGGDKVPERFGHELRLARLRSAQQGLCQCGDHINHELGLATMAALDRNILKPGTKVSDDLINQAIKEVVMHEVGHTLGLRHNFKGSSMLPNEQLHDTKITHDKGLVGSVMDYNPVNLAPRGVKQGDYFTTTIGPYDYWAIEYGYKSLSGGDGESAELKKIASRSAEPGHDYGTDEDLFLTSDPLTNLFDLGADPIKFSQDRMALAADLLKGLSAHVVDDGEGYQRARVAFEILLRQFGDGAYLISKHIAGEHAHRDHRGDPKGRDPLVPVRASKQREALKYIQENVFSDKPFQFQPEMLRRLAAERWYHWGSDFASSDFPLHDRILDIQRVALNKLFSTSVLRRIQNNALKSAKDEQPLTVAEVFRSVSDGIWCDLKPRHIAGAATAGAGGAADEDDKHKASSSIIRRNLQREHLKKLTDLVLGQKKSGGFFFNFDDDDDFSFGGGSAIPPDARSLARMHVREISQRIQATLKDKSVSLDDTTRAHLEECHDRLVKVLNAPMQMND